MTIKGTAGDDVLTGTSGDDVFALYQGGDDTASGLDGNDVFVFRGTFTAADSVDGGAGNDVVRLSGDYSAGLFLSSTSLTSVETLGLGAGFSYKLTTDDANVAAGKTLSINASTLGAGDSLNFNGVNETDGRFSITAGAGDDVLRGGLGNDSFNMAAGGTDRVLGGGGSDTVNMGASLTAADKIDGGGGGDVVVLDGNYTGANAVTFTGTTIVNTNTLLLHAGHSYDLTAADATVVQGGSMTVDAHLLGAGDSLTFDASLGTDDHYVLIGGAGDDDLHGANFGSVNNFANGDTFDLSRGGNDIAEGGPGGDIFLMGKAMNSGDSLDGGGGLDEVVLDGTYTGSNALTLLPGSVRNIEMLILGGAHSYHIEAHNILFENQSLTVAIDISQGHSVVFDASGGSAAGEFIFNTGFGTDASLTGGEGNDVFNLQNAAHYVARGGGGNDLFNFGSNFAAGDVVDGGAGNDQIELTDPSSPITFTGAGFKSIDGLLLASVPGGIFTYNITMGDAAVAAGHTFFVTVASGSDEKLVFNGSAETDGHFDIIGGDEGDTLIGGALSDTFVIIVPSTVTGGGGGDVFDLPFQATLTTLDYNSVSDSTGVNFDSTSNLSFTSDRLHISPLGALPTAIDAFLQGGTLSAATFDSDLTTDLAGHLGAGHAMRYEPTAGDFAKDKFLIVDENGVAGYQAGADLVIEVNGGSGQLTTSFFN